MAELYKTSASISMVLCGASKTREVRRDKRRSFERLWLSYRIRVGVAMIRDMCLKLRDLLVQKRPKKASDGLPHFRSPSDLDICVFHDTRSFWIHVRGAEPVKSFVKVACHIIKRYRFHVSKMPTESDVHWKVLWQNTSMAFFLSEVCCFC